MVNDGESFSLFVGITRRILAPHPFGAACGSSKTLLVFLSNEGFLSSPSEEPNKKPHLNCRWGFLFGAPGGIRTPDQLVRSQLLYPAELRTHKLFIFLYFTTLHRWYSIIRLIHEAHPYGAACGSAISLQVKLSAELRTHKLFNFLELWKRSINDGETYFDSSIKNSHVLETADH